MECLFCKIIAGEEKGWIIYEDDLHVGFLTPFPNTPGFSVLASREHIGSNVMALDENRYVKFLLAARSLAHTLDRKLNTKRTGLMIEGMGIDHAHIKLIPMHGIPEGEWKPILSTGKIFNKTYEGYLSTQDGPRMGDEQLDEIRKKITS